MTKIALLKTWITNIGNGFIDKGAKEIIKQAFPEAEIIEVSGFPNIVNKQHSKGELAGVGQVFDEIFGNNVLSDVKTYFRHKSSNSDAKTVGDCINIVDLLDVDMVVLPGCVLSDHGLGSYYKTLQKISERDVPILLLGVGGGNYEAETVSYISKIIENLNIQGIISRDEVAYSKYAQTVELTHDGVDCAFFIDDWYEPPQANGPFVTVTFDSSEEPLIDTEYEIIRPNHAPFSENVPHSGLLYKLYMHMRNHSDFKKKNSFVSDEIKDYLFLYANTYGTYTDRIHACVPTLVYGNKAVFSYDTPRANLFEKVVGGEIYEKPTRINRQRLDKLKEDQVEAVRDFGEKMIDG